MYQELFNFRLYLCKLHLIGGQLRVGLFLTAPEVFEITEFLSHSGKNELFKFCLRASGISMKKNGWKSEARSVSVALLLMLA